MMSRRMRNDRGVRGWGGCLVGLFTLRLASCEKEIDID